MATKPCQNQLTPIKSELLTLQAKGKPAFCWFFTHHQFYYCGGLLFAGAYWADALAKNQQTATNKFPFAAQSVFSHHWQSAANSS